MSVLLVPLLVVLTTASAIADAERAFAARCAAVGIHQSFLEFFSDDSISFAPEPGPAIARLRAKPAPVKSRALLQWGPEQTEAQGDLGWSTGPSIFSDPSRKQPDRHGYYFSMWRKQSDGTWKVELDLGVDTDQTRVEIPKQATSRDLKETREASFPGHSVIELDRQFCDSLAKNPGQQYVGTLHPDARVHRGGLRPLVGETAWREWAMKLQGTLTCKPTAALLGSGQGLGHSYGTWERRDATGAIAEKGAYVRVWRYEKRWGIAADVATKIE